MTYATIADARDAVYGFLQAGITSRIPSWTSPVIIYDDKETPSPPKDMIPYLRAQMRHTDRRQASVGGAGGRRFRSKFQLTMKLYTQPGKGMADYKVGATTWPGQDTIINGLLRIFEGKTTGIDAVTFYRVTPQEYGEDEGRYRTNLLVNGDYDTVR